MSLRHRTLAAGDLRECGMEFVEASDLRAARRALSEHQSLDTVIADAALPDGTWCGLLGELVRAGVTARVFVCTERQGQLLCGEVVSRAGYSAVVPPHQWRPLRQIVLGAWTDTAPGKACASAAGGVAAAVHPLLPQNTGATGMTRRAGPWPAAIGK